MGERKTLRLVARYADACNLFDIPDGGATIRASSPCSPSTARPSAGPTSEIEKTVSTRLEPGETARASPSAARELAALGIEHAVVISAGPWTDEGLATLAAAIPELVQALRGSGSRV